jgi:hypothetical protein
MKYKYKLVENTGGEDTPIGGGSKGIPKSSVDIVLTPSSDTNCKRHRRCTFQSRKL